MKHLQNVQRQQLAMAIATDPSVLRKFKSGFNECAAEINKYVSQIEGVDEAMKQRINSHLSKCINGIEQAVQFALPGFSGLPIFNAGIFSKSQEPGDQNNNPPVQIPQGLQLIPSRLPTGEFALLLPNSSSLPFLSSLASPHLSSQRPSAFVTVIPSTITSSSEKTPSSPQASPSTSRNDDVILVSHTYPKSPSPQGFRPVQKSTAFVAPQNQVPQVTSSVDRTTPSTSNQSEVKTMRYPIHAYSDRDRMKRSSPRNISEPLCVITNQSERYKQAQTKEDSVLCEENYGLKRKAPEQGLLTVAAPEFLMPESKRLKQDEGFRQINEAGSSGEQSRRNNVQRQNCQDEQQRDMWRPW